MDLNFSIDFDAYEVHGVIDGSITFSVIQDDDGYRYKNFERIDDEYVQDKIKEVCRMLLTIEDY